MSLLLPSTTLPFPLVLVIHWLDTRAHFSHSYFRLPCWPCQLLLPTKATSVTAALVRRGPEAAIHMDQRPSSSLSLSLSLSRSLARRLLRRQAQRSKSAGKARVGLKPGVIVVLTFRLSPALALSRVLAILCDWPHSAFHPLPRSHLRFCTLDHLFRASTLLEPVCLAHNRPPTPTPRASPPFPPTSTRRCDTSAALHPRLPPAAPGDRPSRGWLLVSFPRDLPGPLSTMPTADSTTSNFY